MRYKIKTKKQSLNHFQVNKARIIFSVASWGLLIGRWKDRKDFGRKKSSRSSRVTLYLLSAHPSTPALNSPQESLFGFNTPTRVCYLHMFSARQCLLHRELKQDRRDLASDLKTKPAVLILLLKDQNTYFGEILLSFHFPRNQNGTKKYQIYKKNETGSSLQSKNLHYSELMSSKLFQLCFTQRFFPAYDCSK